MKCNWCGFENAVTEGPCAACGSRLGTGTPPPQEVTVAPTEGTCGNCGHINAPGTLLCGSCGNQVAGAASARSEDRSPFILPDDTLERIAQEEGDPGLFPPEVLEAYRAGRRIAAHTALRAVRDAERSRTAVRHRVLASRRIWAQVSSAPAMMTLNGLGTNAYGQADPGPDGTFILTNYFVFLFIPLYPLSSHLVIRNTETWRSSWFFLAQVPLSDFSRTHQRLFWIGLLLVVMVSVVGPVALSLLGG